MALIWENIYRKAQNINLHFFHLFTIIEEYVDAINSCFTISYWNWILFQQIIVLSRNIICTLAAITSDQKVRAIKNRLLTVFINKIIMILVTSLVKKYWRNSTVLALKVPALVFIAHVFVHSSKPCVYIHFMKLFRWQLLNWTQ